MRVTLVARKSSRKRSSRPRSQPAAVQAEGAPTRRPVWSGTLAFGLVTLPVDLYSTTRASRAALRMIDADGTPLKRRYVSQEGGALLTDREIVRGYPIEDEFVVIEDEELEALDPKRSRTIDLESFVRESDLDPSYIENAYVLVPDPEATTAYRLLVSSMADAGRAGMATFVMRGRAYAVAIVARDGTLRALTLRYHDELRTPADIGLGELKTAPAEDVKRSRREIVKLASDSLDMGALTDRASQRLRAAARKKLAKGKDVHQVDEAEVEPEADDADFVDIMELLRRSLGPSVEA